MNGLHEQAKIGLTTEQAKELQQQFGKNELVPKKTESVFLKMLRVVCEPMFLLLIAASVIYFLLGEPKDGAIMLIFVVAVIGIEAIQEIHEHFDLIFIDADKNNYSNRTRNLCKSCKTCRYD